MKSLIQTALVISTFTLSPSLQASTFNEVWRVINDDGFVPKTSIETSEFNVYQSGALPRYEVNTSTIFPKGSDQMSQDAKRTVTRTEDYYTRLPKLLHANGICLAGQWEMTEASKYTGLFAKGSKALFIGRASVTMSGTEFSEKRGFGIAGKIFPTLDENESVQTANFFSIEVLLGVKKENFMDAAMTNEPETGFDLSLIGLGMKIASAFSSADNNPGFRPLYPVSEATLAEGQSAVTPKWFRLRAADGQMKNNEKDFRNEILKALKDNTQLVINVEVSDKGSDRENNSLWKKLGTITFNEAVVSYGCDRRLHFPHPKMK